MYVYGMGLRKPFIYTWSYYVTYLLHGLNKIYKLYQIPYGINAA